MYSYMPLQHPHAIQRLTTAYYGTNPNRPTFVIPQVLLQLLVPSATSALPTEFSLRTLPTNFSSSLSLDSQAPQKSPHLSLNTFQPHCVPSLI